MAEPTMSYERSIESAGIALASGDHASAERALRAAIHVVEALDDSHIELASALTKLGTLKQELGSHGEAEEFFQRALTILERDLGADHLGLVSALKGLGTTRLLQGSAESAEPLLARALSISQRHLGDDHPDQVILLNDLTRLYLKQSAHAFAEPLLLRLLELKRHKGDDHPEVATVLASLASVRQALGRHESAEHLWRRVLGIRERTLAPNHFSLATTLEQLAQTCAARGKLTEAVHLYQRAVSIREATLGRDHPSVRSSRERIADLELQASEASMDLGDVPLPVTAERPRVLTDEALGLVPYPVEPVLSAHPAPAAPAAPQAAPAVIPVARSIERVEPRRIERFEPVAPPAPVAREPMAVAKPAPADPAAYLNALMDIKDELDITEADEAPKGVALGATVAAFLQKRRVAAIVGVGALTLPLAAWAVVGVARAGEMKWAENAPATPAQTVQLVAQVTDPAPRLTHDAKDSTATAKPAAPVRQAGKPVENEEEPVIAIAKPSLTVRVDSVRPNSSLLGNGDAAMRHLSSVDPASAKGASMGAPVRARLIGFLPTPRYPKQQLRGRTGGEVRVRFDVDTSGRPIMSTFTVLGSPLGPFITAVREVIPTIRFEPARTPWPELRPMMETVELRFAFTPPDK
jgi:tetratricopeptide (TPR) repeat protein